MTVTPPTRPTVAVLGGAIAGLAVAERFSAFADETAYLLTHAAVFTVDIER